MGLFTKRQLTGQVDKNSLPRHVAVIMDGNGRWAQKRGLPRSAGHKAGAESFRRLGTYCKKLGIDYLTVYAFPRRTGSARSRRSTASCNFCAVISTSASTRWSATATACAFSAT